MPLDLVPMPSVDGSVLMWIDPNQSALTIFNEADRRMHQLGSLTFLLSAMENPVTSAADVANVCAVLHQMASDSKALYEAAFDAAQKASSSP